MKKHYRGKRHMHARRTVSIGREKRKRAKWKSLVKFVKSGKIQRAAKQLAEDMALFSNDIQGSIDAIREVSMWHCISERDATK